MKTQLLCTFTVKPALDITLQLIQERYKILYNKIFVLEIVAEEEYVCSYNIEHDVNSQFIPRTVAVHRKKETNTLYTINALNCIVREINNGKTYISTPVDWNLYSNMLLLTDSNQIKKLPTKLHKIISL